MVYEGGGWVVSSELYQLITGLIVASSCANVLFVCYSVFVPFVCYCSG